MFSGHYNNWRGSRMNAIDKYILSDFFHQKTMLELGAGYCDNGYLFHKKGCIVTSSDVREEHLSVAKERYPNLKLIKLDCDKDKISEKYDIILHWGILYHLNDIENHMKNVCEACDYLLLETEVCISDEKTIIKTQEEGWDQAFNTVGSRPSEKYVEDLLKTNGFNFKLIKDSILNAEFHVYDWDYSDEYRNRNPMGWNHGIRRYWICWRSSKQSPLKNN